MLFTENQVFEETFTVSEEIYGGFIGLFNDKNPLHTDRKFAVQKGFNDIVMHGNILNGFLSYFVGGCLPTKDVIIHSQEIHFKNPVYMNDILTFTARVSGVFESVNAVEFKYEFCKNSQFIDNQIAMAGCKFPVVAKGKIQIGII
jgi:3-hydroxybutyryl-CoA dehydratase